MMPREHGAWAMLLIPFVSAVALARKLTWEVVPAAVLVVGIFLVREPLLALWRQKLVWKQPRVEAAQARRALAWRVPAIAACALVLLWRLPVAPLLVMGTAALLLTAISTHLAVQNRQRSIPLQIASAAGLNASALLAWMAVGAGWGWRIWALWALQFAHSGAAVVAVHARLQARIASRTGSGPAGFDRGAAAGVILLALAAAACAAAGKPALALASGLSAVIRAVDLARLRDPASLDAPLRRVGQRELLGSIVFSLLLLFGLR